MADFGLLVGINKYDGCPLNGCVNDITEAANFLVENYNFDKSGIRLLTDHRATKQNIMDRLNWLVKNLKSGDRGIYYFSGHGIFLTTRDAENGQPTEIGACECPINFDFTRKNALSHLDFLDVFGKIPDGVKFNWVSDSCFSGKLSEKEFLAKNNYRRSKNYPVPEDIHWRNESAKAKGLKVITHKDISEQLGLTYVSGCGDQETSCDAFINNVYRGALSYYLLNEIKKNTSTPMVEIVAKVNEDLAENNYDQHPKTYGKEINLPFF